MFFSGILKAPVTLKLLKTVRRKVARQVWLRDILGQYTAAPRERANAEDRLFSSQLDHLQLAKPRGHRGGLRFRRLPPIISQRESFFGIHLIPGGRAGGRPAPRWTDRCQDPPAPARTGFRAAAMMSFSLG